MKKNLAGRRIRKARALQEPPLTQDMLIARMHTQANIVLSKNMLSRIEIDISKNGIFRIEHDDRYITDIELAAFSRVLKVPVDWLWDGCE